MIVLMAAPLVTAAPIAATPALAQSNPSTSQIIQSLKPSGNLLQGGTRGIRLVSPNAAPAAPVRPPPSTRRPASRRQFIGDNSIGNNRPAR